LEEKKNEVFISYTTLQENVAFATNILLPTVLVAHLN